MFDRHFVGDAALAVLLAIPLAALMPPDPVGAAQKQVSAHHGYQLGSVAQSDRPVSLLR